MQIFGNFEDSLPRIWALIPAKPLSEAKSRLSPILTPNQRATLALNLFRHTLLILQNLIKAEPGILAGVLVVSSDQSLLEVAQDLNALTYLAHPETADYREQGQLNRDLRAATIYLDTITHFDRILILPTDLPLIAPSDVRELLSATQTEATLVPDHARRGTNGLYLTHQAAIEMIYCFGETSFEGHQQELLSRNISYREQYNPALAFDLDRIEDFLRLPETLRTQLLEE